MTGVKNNKILPLESMRGIAAICIAIFHFWNTSILSNNLFISHAPVMVDFFFVLSGYVISMNYWNKILCTNDAVSFQIKRFWRIYPLHFTMLLVFLGIEVLKFFVEKYTGIVANNPAFSRNDTQALFHNVFLTHGFFLNSTTFDFPSWSISTEFYTYLIFSLIMITGNLRFTLCALVVVLSFFVLMIYDPYFEEYSLGIFRCIYAFFIGALGYRICKKLLFQGNEFFALASVIIFFLSVCFIYKTPLHILYPFFFLICIVGLSFSNSNTITVRFLSAKPLVYLGTISYSIYMVHAAVWWGFNQILRYVFKVPATIDNLGRVRFEMHQLYALPVTILGIITVIVISHYTYILIENKYRRGINNSI